jgi:hypothetical protein
LVDTEFNGAVDIIDQSFKDYGVGPFSVSESSISMLIFIAFIQLTSRKAEVMAEFAKDQAHMQELTRRFDTVGTYTSIHPPLLTCVCCTSISVREQAITSFAFQRPSGG